MSHHCGSYRLTVPNFRDFRGKRFRVTAMRATIQTGQKLTVEGLQALGKNFSRQDGRS